MSVSLEHFFAGNDGTAKSGEGDAEMTDVQSDPAASSTNAVDTGMYELAAVLTHKGRSADSGHYVAWVKQSPGRLYYQV